MLSFYTYVAIFGVNFNKISGHFLVTIVCWCVQIIYKYLQKYLAN